MEEDRKYALSILYMNNESRCFQTMIILIQKQKTSRLNHHHSQKLFHSHKTMGLSKIFDKRY